MIRMLVVLASLVAVDAVRTESLTISERVSILYHPDSMVEVTGGLVVRRADLGARLIGTDGMNAAVLAADDGVVGLAAYPDHLGNPRDLVMVTVGGRIGVAGAESVVDPYTGEAFLVMLVDGDEVLIPYYPRSAP